MVEVYWRPGCPYCMSLRRGLSRAGVPTREINIWADPAAAAFVRSVAHGNETVPTVVVAGGAMVNPSTREVLAATGAMPDQPGARSRPFHAGAGYGLLAAARATATVTGVALTVVVAAGL